MHRPSNHYSIASTTSLKQPSLQPRKGNTEPDHVHESSFPSQSLASVVSLSSPRRRPPWMLPSSKGAVSKHDIDPVHSRLAGFLNSSRFGF